MVDVLVTVVMLFAAQGGQHAADSPHAFTPDAGNCASGHAEEQQGQVLG